MYYDPPIVDKKKKSYFKLPEYMKDEPPFTVDLLPDAAEEETPITIVPREGWGAKPPASEVPNTLPVAKVKFTGENIFKHDSFLTRALLKTQKYYMEELKEPDVPFNFLIHKGGLVFEGRGWKNRPRYKEEGVNVLEIAFAGEFKGLDTPSFEQMDTALSLLRKGVREEYIDENFSIASLKQKSEIPEEYHHWYASFNDDTVPTKPFLKIKFYK